jgi:hypothetical protein
LLCQVHVAELTTGSATGEACATSRITEFDADDWSVANAITRRAPADRTKGIARTAGNGAFELAP